MAAWLEAQSDPATWIWTSTAARARATAAFVQTGFRVPDHALISVDDLYHASPEQILEVVRQTPSEVEGVAVVAHNPGMTWLVNGMGRDAITDNLATFGVARFDCDGDWATLRAGSARLDFLVSPKTLPDRND
jgi:phosphohistidine phosphatase